MPFQFHALAYSQFEPLFSMSDGDLEKVRATKMVADGKPGYPCRVSLTEADIGETVILINYVHQPANTPFQSSHAIYVRENAEQAVPGIGIVPEMFINRLISIRAFNNRHYIVNADVIDGSRLRYIIPTIFQDLKVTYLHLHNAKLGCFLAQVTRAPNNNI